MIIQQLTVPNRPLNGLLKTIHNNGLPCFLVSIIRYQGTGNNTKLNERKHENMRKDDITKRIIESCIDTYKRGLYSVPDCFQQIDKAIQKETWLIPDVDEKIKRQNRLYKYGLALLHKAIVQMDRHSN